MTLASRRRRAAADDRQRGAADRGGAGAVAPTPRRRRMPGWCWPRARIAKDAGGVSLDVNGDGAQGRALSQRQARRACRQSAAGRPIPARRPVQAVVSVTGAPIVPEPAAETRLQDRAHLLHARRRAGRSDQGQAEPALRRGAEDHRAAAAIRPRSSSPTICRPASRSTIRGWCRRARPARWAGSRMRRSRCIPNSATTASARPSTARASDAAVFTVAYVVRAVSPGTLRAAAGLCRGHVPARPLRPHRHRHDRGDRAAK